MGHGGLKRIIAVAANTFRETVRERVLYNLVFFAVLMTLSGLLMRELSIRQDEKIIKDIGLAAIEVFGTAIAIFIGVGLVSKEIERRSLVPLIAKPLSRDEFLLGKVAGLAFTLFVNVACMSLGLAATLFLTRRSPGWSLLFAILPIYLNLILVVALAVLFSTMTSSMMAVICTMSLTVAGRFSDILRNARQVLPGTPRWLTETLYYLLPNFRNFDFKDRVIYGDPFASGELLWVGGYAAAYIGALLTLSLVIFRKKELP